MSYWRKISLCFLLCAILWLAGLGWFIAQIPQTVLTDIPPSDAIVVLTGGSGRLEYGLELLAEGHGQTLFITGVSRDLTMSDILRHASPDMRKKLDTSRITLGHDAENTIGNAEETARWLKKHHAKTIRLVTANYHMPRSIEEFEETAPGVTIIPAPVFPDDFTPSGWWRERDSRHVLLSEYHKFLASKLRHWLLSVTRRSP